MNALNAMTRRSAVLLWVIALSACGGGDPGLNGGGTGSTDLPPVAEAGPDQSVVEGASVTLTGSGTDSDGSVVLYQWQQTAGTGVTLTDANKAAARFTAPASGGSIGTLSFTLTVFDNLGAHASDSVTVTVNPVASAGATFTIDDASAAEGAGSMSFTVHLSADLATPASVSYATQDGTAVAGADYTATSGTLNFAAHQLTATIGVPVAQDSVHEGNEIFSVKLSAPSAGITLARDTAAGTIIDDDAVAINDIGYGTGVTGALARFGSNLNSAIAALAAGQFSNAGTALGAALTRLAQDTGGIAAGDQASLSALIQDLIANAQKQDADRLLAQAAADAGAVAGLGTDPVTAVANALSVERGKQAMVITGSQLPAWSVPAAYGLPYPYPSGATITGGWLPGQLQKNGGRDAHNGVILYPLLGNNALALSGKPVERIAAYRWDGSKFIEIPVQVDQRFPYFLANSNSSFSVYSGTDEELTYQWDHERWANTNRAGNACYADYAAGMSDPVSGLDDDDEIAFMVQDAGAQAPASARPDDVDPSEILEEVHLVDALTPAYGGVVYLGLKKSGMTAKYLSQQVYVNYKRDTNADQWIDHTFFADDSTEKIGTSNTGYGSNLSGTVCPDGTLASARDSTDRAPRDATTVSTDSYKWHSSGRWMVREIHVAKPGQSLPAGRAPGQGVQYSPDLIDRWKGRAFQQSPDSNISIVGFEDEQVNWEANSILVGDRQGPVRAIRETWGADSGTNVTKTETFYRDAVAYRYHLRVHPIPPDGLYTSWDYNRSAMVPGAGENVPAGRYYTILRPQGVPVDGVNDDIGQIDGILPVAGQCLSLDAKGFVPPAPDGRCPAFFDVSDPTFNLPLAFANWEQISGKGDYGSLVYTFELKGATSAANPLVIPFYRDDACLDDGTGDDPVPRPYPGEAQTDPRVRAGYVRDAGGDTSSADAINTAFNNLRCDQKQGAYGANGVHYLFTQDSDNAFLLGIPIDEVDGQQWQFMVPTAQPTNVGQRYYNLITVPLLPLVVPRPPGV